MSFLADYREFCSGLEVPPSFNTFCSLVGLSSLLGRRVYTMKGDYIRIYPNLYVILVGPPGCGKTTAMETVEDLLHEFKVPISAESVSREKLIMDIQAQEGVHSHLPPEHKYRYASPYTIFATELSEFLGAGGIGMISFLTDIYSRNLFEVRTKNKGITKINGPYINLIAGTTTDWINTYLKDDIISGGFSRRCVFVHETGRAGSIPRPKITPAMRAAWQRVVDRAKAVGTLAGEYTWSEDAIQFWDNWYHTRIPAVKDPNLLGYYETKDIQLLKVAMLVAVSESNELVLTKRHMLAGLDLLSLVEYNMSRVFQGVGKNELNTASVKIMDLLHAAPRTSFQHRGEIVEVPMMPLKRLQSFLWKDIQQAEFEQVIKYLQDSDKIGRGEYPPGSNRIQIWIKPQD